MHLHKLASSLYFVLATSPMSLYGQQSSSPLQFKYSAVGNCSTPDNGGIDCMIQRFNNSRMQNNFHPIDPFDSQKRLQITWEDVRKKLDKDFSKWLPNEIVRISAFVRLGNAYFSSLANQSYFDPHDRERLLSMAMGIYAAVIFPKPRPSDKRYFKLSEKLSSDLVLVENALIGHASNESVSTRQLSTENRPNKRK